MNITKTDTTYDTLYKAFEERIGKLKELPQMDRDNSIEEVIKENGFSRRDFMQWAGAITAMLSLPATFIPLMAEAVKVADRLPIIWLHMAECTGWKMLFGFSGVV